MKMWPSEGVRILLVRTLDAVGGNDHLAGRGVVAAVPLLRFSSDASERLDDG